MFLPWFQFFFRNLIYGRTNLIAHYMTTMSIICMIIQTHTVLQKLCLGIKITTQGNYVTLIIICHEHQNKLKPNYNPNPINLTLTLTINPLKYLHTPPPPQPAGATEVW